MWSKKRIIFVSVVFCIFFCLMAFTFIGRKPAKEDWPVHSGRATNYCIYVQVEDKTLYLLQDGICVKKYLVATGAPKSPSPLGCWKIIQKGDWGEGFGGSWMGLNVPWGKYGIHGTNEVHSIGNAQSHGCIRMYNEDVRELFNIVPYGTPVVIVEGCFGPFGSGYKAIHIGDRGANVAEVQKRLKRLGYFKGRVSGIYEDSLKIAVHKFQKEKKHKVQNTITKRDWQAMGFIEFE